MAINYHKLMAKLADAKAIHMTCLDGHGWTTHVEHVVWAPLRGVLHISPPLHFPFRLSQLLPRTPWKKTFLGTGNQCEIVDLPIENGGSFHSYVILPEGTSA